MIAPYHPDTSDFTNLLAAPSRAHLLGTDELGRDTFSRLVWGSRASIQAGVFATLLATLIAVPIGLAAGYYRGWIDPVIARVTDVLLAFPFLIVAVGLAAILGASLRNATIALCLGAIPGLIRVVRGEALALREEDYVARRDRERRRRPAHPRQAHLPEHAADDHRADDRDDPGADHRRGRAVVPRPRRAVAADSWGVMLSDAKDYYETAPQLILYPGLAIFFCSLSFNLLGDGLRDVLDPRTTR